MSRRSRSSTPDATLRQLLGDRVRQARAAYPDVAVTDEQLVDHVAHALGDAPDVPAALARLQLNDLYLACACALGVDSAVRRFDRELLAAVPRMVARVERDPAIVEELQQAMRVHLLVAEPGRRPRIAEYAGRGPLAAWVGVTALRAALELKRRMRERVAPSRDLAAASLAGSHDPELEALRARYQADYQAALREALTTLTAREQNLLRLYYVDGSSIDKVAARFRVHRATAARRINAASERLLSETRARLIARLGLRDSEFDTLLRLVRDELYVSLSLAFGDPP